MISINKLIPITYKKWDIPVNFTYNYYDVEFLEDFGCIRKGFYDCVAIDYTNGIIKIYGMYEIIEYEQKFTITPIN